MIPILSRFIHWAGDQIDTEQAADGPPPTTLRRFMLWCLKGGWRVVWMGAAISVIAGVTEVLSMYLLFSGGGSSC